MDNSVHYDVLNTARAAMAMASSSARRTAAIAPDSHDAAVRHVKRRTCDLDFDTLECPVCTHLLYPPVFQCNSGHTACASCCEKLPKKLCPSCALPIGSSRCIAVEKIIESLQVPCKHAASGCKEKLHYTRSDEHEEACEYRLVHCPLACCFFISSRRDITVHFQTKHIAEVYKLETDSDDGKLLLDVNIKSRSLESAFIYYSEPSYIIVQGCKGSGVSLLHHRLDKALCKISFFYSSFGLCSQSYRLSITVGRQGIKHRYSIEAPVCDNQFGKDWLTKMEQQSNFLSVFLSENPGLNDGSKNFEIDLELL